MLSKAKKKKKQEGHQTENIVSNPHINLQILPLSKKKDAEIRFNEANPTQ